MVVLTLTLASVHVSIAVSLGGSREPPRGTLQHAGHGGQTPGPRSGRVPAAFAVSCLALPPCSRSANFSPGHRVPLPAPLAQFLAGCSGVAASQHHYK